MNLIESLMEEFDFVPINSKQMYFTIAKMPKSSAQHIWHEETNAEGNFKKSIRM